jgi:hypothetical protein
MRDNCDKTKHGVNASCAAKYRCHAEAIKLRIVGVLLVSDLLAGSKVTNRRDKYRKENRSKYRI